MINEEPKQLIKEEPKPVIKEDPKPVIIEQPKSRVEEPKKIQESKPFETKSKEFYDVISTALNEAILPSKSPIPQDDPFNYLISRKYLRMFLLATSAFVFGLSLFD